MAALAVTQHGVFTLYQLVDLGLAASTVRERLATGRLYRVHRGVYSLAPPQLLSRNGRFMAAVLACGLGAALSHRSAGALLELVSWNSLKVDVSVPTPGGRSSREGIRVHRATTLRPSDIVLAQRIPCTTVARTLLDLAELLDRRGVERALDQAAILEVLDLTRLRDQIEHNPTRRASAVLQAVLAEHLPGSTPTWNELEERMLALTRRIGIADPEVQQWLDLGDGWPMIRADFLWREQRVIVEADGFQAHGMRTAFEDDRRRDQRAIQAGWRPIRVTWRQLTNEPERLEKLLLVVVGRSAAAR
ncbi:MAG: type IV toxin-antitoxin system AbiEi family antitoxin domain-containing protein [Solirubrobacteraceae bacterium]